MSAVLRQTASRVAAISAAIALGARITAGPRDRPGGAVHCSLELLLPCVRERVERVLERMRADGHDPLVWESLRSEERAAELEQRGTGSRRSLHCYGAAVDIICAQRMWKASRKFWRDLVRHAEAEGLTCGARWSRVDLPHLQAVPVRLQNALRALATLDEREAFCRRVLEGDLAAAA